MTEMARDYNFSEKNRNMYVSVSGTIYWAVIAKSQRLPDSEDIDNVQSKYRRTGPGSNHPEYLLT